MRSLIWLISLFAVVGMFYFMQNMRSLISVEQYNGSASAQLVAEPVTTPSQNLAAIAEARLKQLVPESSRFWDTKSQEQQAQIIKRFAAGDYGATLQMVRSLLNATDTRAEFRAWLREQFPVILVSKGWLDLKAGQCEDAIDEFQEADRYKVLPESLKGQAFCRYKLNDMTNASSYARQYFDVGPPDPALRIIHAESLESQNRFREAAETLAQALTSVTEDDTATKANLDTRLKSMKAKIPEGDEQLTLNHNMFSITYKPETHDGALNLAIEVLDSTLDELTSQWGFNQPKRTIEIVLYDSKDFHSIVTNGPEWAQGIFDGRMRIPVAPQQVSSNQWARTFSRVLRHELIHALLHEMTAGVQLHSWVNEGLAQRLECGGSGCGSFEFAPASGGMLTQEDLRRPYTTLSQADATRAYGQSLYLVLTLERAMGLENALPTLIRNVSATTASDDDLLLKGSGTDFSRLHGQASKLWKQKQRL